MPVIRALAIFSISSLFLASSAYAQTDETAKACQNVYKDCMATASEAAAKTQLDSKTLGNTAAKTLDAAFDSAVNSAYSISNANCVIEEQRCQLDACKKNVNSACECATHRLNTAQERFECMQQCNSTPERLIDCERGCDQARTETLRNLLAFCKE